MTKLKFTTSLFLALFLIAGSASAQDALGLGAKIADKIVAQIGEEIILLSDVRARELQALQNGGTDNNSLQCIILEELLFEKLLVNQAKIDSVEVSDERVNQEMEARINEIAEKIGGVDKLEDFYGKSVAKIKADFFEQIKKRLMAEEMRAEITQNVRITPKQVETFYNKLPKDSVPYINAKVIIGQIVIYPQVTLEDKKKAKNQLNAWRDDILGGVKGFETIATLYSEDPGSRLNGGDLGWQSRGNMVPEFEAALFALEKGEISPIFESTYGYHIIQLIERKGDNYHARHILRKAQVNDKALMKTASLMDSLHKELVKGTITFEEVAKRFSDDDASKQNGGKIVNNRYSGDYLWDIQDLNDIDPQMSRTVNAMKPGNFSSPSLYDNMFEQKKGIRIVQLIKKTKPHRANLKDDYTFVSTAAANEKKQETIEKWVNSKLGGTYIRIENEYLKKCDFSYDWVRVGS